MAKAKTCEHIINGVNGDRVCGKDAFVEMGVGGALCSKHLHVMVSRTLKATKPGAVTDLHITTL